MTIRPKPEVPIVGFCGQAVDSVTLGSMKMARTAYRNLRYRFGSSHDEPQVLLPSSYLRARALAILERAAGIETRFIRRRRCHSASQPGQRVDRAARREFWNSIRKTDYTVCVRGSGNFSARLYETLAMGRIPVFVDTDCKLPYERTIDWKKYCVWVDQSALSHLAERVLAFHASLDKEEFEQLQADCRKMREDRLSFSGFFTHFAEHFDSETRV